MNIKSALITGVMALASLSIASAKTYDIALGNPTLVGSMQLKPGLYKIKVDGSQVVFTNTENSKSFTIAVKTEDGGARFDQTTLHSDSQNGMDKLREIDLGGSSTKLEFGQ